MAKQLILPCKGTIKATGEVVNIERETTVAGLKCYEVRFLGSRTTYNYQRGKVVPRPSMTE